MKKIFIALSVLAALTFGVGSALAVPGIPDNVPGSDFTSPFLVSHQRVATGSGQTTLLNLSEVRGFATDFHCYFYTTKSVYVADAWVPITHWGTIMKDVATFIDNMSDADRERLTITYVDGTSYYAGYIEAENNIYVWNAGAGVWQRQRGTRDNVIGSLYMLNLSEGQAAASNLPMREFYNRSWFDLTLAQAGVTWAWTNDQLFRWAITGSSYLPSFVTGLMPVTKFGVTNQYENFSPVAQAAATNAAWNRIPTTTNYVTRNAAGAINNSWNAPYAAWFRLIPEYYILDASGRTVFAIWQRGLANGTTFHMYVINDAEDYYSTTIPIDEVTFLDAIDWIPSGLQVTYPYSGIFNWTTRDTSYNTTPWVWEYAEFLGWSWQQANNGAATAATNWSILKEMARDVGTSGVAPRPVHIF